MAGEDGASPLAYNEATTWSWDWRHCFRTLFQLWPYSFWFSQTCIQGSPCDQPGIISWNTLAWPGIGRWADCQFIYSYSHTLTSHTLTSVWHTHLGVLIVCETWLTDLFRVPDFFLCTAEAVFIFFCLSSRIMVLYIAFYIILMRKLQQKWLYKINK